VYLFWHSPRLNNKKEEAENIKINENAGVMDRIIRLVAGIALIAAGLTVAKGTRGIFFLILSTPLLISPLFLLFPIYGR